MGIDYAGLYAHDYFGHQSGARSFRPDFPALLVALARDLGCEGVVDAGAGNGDLVHHLRTVGLPGVPLDLRPDTTAGVLPFDLTADDGAQVVRVREEAATRFPGGPYLTTCLDVLEHIGRTDMAAAVGNLRELTGEWLLVSASTRPSSRDNLYHATVIPRRSWRRLFEAAGFEAVTHPGLEDMPYHIDYPGGDPFFMMNQWRRLDPYGDSRGTEAYYLLLRKRAAPFYRDGFSARAAAILQLPLNGPDRVPTLHPETRLTFLLGHYQDFHHYRPYWDAVDRRAVTVLVRSGALQGMEPKRYRAVIAYLKSHGLNYQEVQTVSEVDWDAPPGRRRALIVATESTAIDTHRLNAAFVLAARGAGYRTYQIQHGIWPHVEFDKPFTFAAETVLAWSDEYRRGFTAEAAGLSDQPHPTAAARYTLTGCAKFDDLADQRPVSTADLFGDWAEPYERSVLVATNLHWGMHRTGADVIPAMIALAARHPNILFVCKLHPAHDADEPLLGDLPANLKVLDEFVCLAADLQTPRLVLACDAVICTPSTIALEAAIAGRPFAILDTGNPVRYANVDPVPITELDAELSRLLAPENRDRIVARQAAFRDHYYDPSLIGRGLTRIIETIEADLAGPAPAGRWADPHLAAARTFATTFADQYVPNGRARVAALEQQAGQATAGAEELRVRLQQVEAELAQVQGERNAANDRAGDADRRHATAVAELDAAQARHAAAAAERDALRVSYEATAADLDATRAGHAVTAADLDATRARLADVDAELGLSRLDRLAVQNLLGESEARRSAVTAELVSVRSRLDAVEDDLRTVDTQRATALEGVAESQRRNVEVTAQLEETRVKLALSETDINSTRFRLLRAEADLDAAGGRLAQAMEQLSEADERLADADQRLARFGDLGPASIRVAKGVRRLANRHPLLSSWFKSIARRGLRLVGR